MDAGEYARVTMESKITNTRSVAANKTTAPVEPGAIGSPEFCRPSDVRHLFGIGRSYVYQLIASGDVRSVSLRRRGAKTGCRLIDVQSLRDYLRAEMGKAS